MSLIDQLRSSYGNVQKLPNGGYLATNRSGDQLYVPANYTGTTGLLSYLPGTGGSGNDARQLRAKINSSNPPQYAISISKRYQDKNNTLERSYQALTNSGINISNVTEVSFSASGGVGFRRLNDFLARHPNVKATMFCNNAYGMETFVKNNNTSPLRNNNTPIILIDPKGRKDTISAINRMQSAGLNSYWLQTGYSDHPGLNHDMLHNGLVEYSLGYASSIGQNRLNGSSCGYRLLKLDPKTGKYVTANYQDMINGTAVYAIADSSAIMGFDGFTISTDQRVTTANKVLSGLTDLSLTSKSGKISVNYEYVNTAMNELRGVIKSTNFLANSTNMNLRSADGIPGCINEYLNKYYDLVTELLTSLAFQSESIESYAQALIDMDHDMSIDANNVGTIKETDFDSPTPQTSYDPKSEDSQTGQENVDNNSNNEDYSGSGGSSHSGGHSSGGGSSSGNSLGSLGALGSAGLGEQETKHKEIWFEYDDGHHGIIVYDGDRIAEVKYSYTYESNVKATADLPFFQETFENDESIEKVQVNDIYIELIIKPEKYTGLNVSQIKETFFKEVTKDGQTVLR